ncbi:MAG: UbiA family prenyltransferase [bacterium]|nr:UbiA family prenyltransferase [bacterium]
MKQPDFEAAEPPRAPLPAAGAADYLAMARPDHWLKHIFILPGIVLAYMLHPTDLSGLLVPVALGLVSAALVASANYVLNEWLDREQDAFHPTKSRRPAVRRRLSPTLVAVEYAALTAIGLVIAAALSPLFLLTTLAFLASAWIYNVRPLRTKDRVYLDVTSEAINNPIRLTLGWAMVSPTTLPPSSLLLAYWMGGAFLMAIKRFAEYRSVAASAGLERLGRYRTSFRHYSENSLLVSAFLYALMAAFFLAVFVIKYRVEYLLALPLFAALFAAYLRVGLKRGSSAQTPEKLFREKVLMIIVALLILALALLTWIDIPRLERLTAPHYIHLPWLDERS